VVRGAWTSPSGVAIRPVHPVVTAGPIPNDAIVVTSALHGLDRASLLRFLLSPPTPEAKALLADTFNTTEFRIAKDNHLAPLRDMVRTARSLGYDSLIPHPFND
jgi:ABC-type phosphate/phosphonate transport system substrate-binding protein